MSRLKCQTRSSGLTMAGAEAVRRQTIFWQHTTYLKCIFMSTSEIKKTKTNVGPKSLTSALSSVGHHRMDEEETQVQGCRATPGDRNRERSLHRSSTHRCMEATRRKYDSPVFTGIRLLYLMFVVMFDRSPPSIFFYRRDGSEKAAPRLASKRRTESRRGGLR